jgi:hypothetical protein
MSPGSRTQKSDRGGNENVQTVEKKRMLLVEKKRVPAVEQKGLLEVEHKRVLAVEKKAG